MRRLPTLYELVSQIKKTESEWLRRGGWEESFLPFPPDAGWDLPMVDFRNRADTDKFIIVQTQKGRHTLKPNLVEKPFIFRGQNKKYPHIISSFSKDELPDKNGHIDMVEARKKHLVANLRVEEFIALLQTHPLFMLLDRGISLYPEKRPLFINMNYYGLAQHYNFKTAVIDFTTDIDVAAFFACTINLGNDTYEPIVDTKMNPKGVIYVHRILPDFTFKFGGFSTIGLQLYPRSGIQKGILHNEGIAASIETQVNALEFQHNAQVSRYFYKKMDSGKRLFPEDGIDRLAEEILNGNEISGETFTKNLYSNQDDLQENLNALEDKGIVINWHKKPHFDSEALHQIYQDIKNGLWEQFCNQVYFADANEGAIMHDSLLNLPKNPSYQHFFREDEYRRFTAYEQDLHSRAKRNALKRHYKS